jgi:hypothetical protein
VQLEAVADDLGLAVLAVLAGGKVALLNRATIREALGALQKKLGAFATAKAADWSGITCHFFFFSRLRMTAGLHVVQLLAASF